MKPGFKKQNGNCVRACGGENQVATMNKMPALNDLKNELGLYDFSENEAASSYTCITCGKTSPRHNKRHPEQNHCVDNDGCSEGTRMQEVESFRCQNYTAIREKIKLCFMECKPDEKITMTGCKPMNPKNKCKKFDDAIEHISKWQQKGKTISWRFGSCTEKQMINNFSEYYSETFKSINESRNQCLSAPSDDPDSICRNVARSSSSISEGGMLGFGMINPYGDGGMMPLNFLQWLIHKNDIIETCHINKEYISTLINDPFMDFARENFFDYSNVNISGYSMGGFGFGGFSPFGGGGIGMGVGMGTAPGP
jgi:hypothetical protein